MIPELYELTESPNPVSGRSEVTLRYDATKPSQSIVFLRDHWIDLLMDELVRHLQTNPQAILNHPYFENVKTLMDQHRR